jgi:hypothetical protein
MSEAPERLHVCTNGAVASDFKAGIIFASPRGPNQDFATVEYVRADLVGKVSRKEDLK